jgi:integrase
MRSTRLRLATGIYKDASGIAIIISVRGTPRELRRDAAGRPYATRDTSWLIQERKRRHAAAHLTSERTWARTQTLTADVGSYVQMLSGRTRDDVQNLLQHWTQAFGDRDRHELTAVELRQHAATWRCKPSTFNHRRQALISLYVALDGKHAANPARDIPKQTEHQGAPKALSYAIIESALARMPKTQSRARLLLMAYTGLPQMQIQKLTPDDWQGARLRVTPRRKGSGTAGRWLPLSVEAQAAMAEFARLHCWGDFSRSSLMKAWKAVGPKGTSPYALRHSWITELYRRSNGDVLAVKQLALHSQLSQTERYAAAALEDRMTALVVPRESATTGSGKSSKSVQKRPSVRRSKRRGKHRPKR